MCQTRLLLRRVPPAQCFFGLLYCCSWVPVCPESLYDFGQQAAAVAGSLQFSHSGWLHQSFRVPAGRVECCLGKSAAAHCGKVQVLVLSGQPGLLIKAGWSF